MAVEEPDLDALNGHRAIRQVRMAERRPSSIGGPEAELRRSAASCAHWIRSAVGEGSATVRVAVPDAAGRLRVIASDGQHEGLGRMRSSRRRTAFLTGEAIHVPIQGSPGLSLGIFPIVHDDDDVLGVVEIVAPADRIIWREEVVRALIGQSALVLDTALVRSQTERALAGMTAISRLAPELLEAKTATEAVRVTVGVCFDYLAAPVAGLLPDRDGWGWFLVGTGGLGSRRRVELRAVLRARGDGLERRRAPVATLRRRFREITGCREVAVLRAGGAILLVGDAQESHGEFLDRAESILGAALAQSSVSRRVRARNQARDLGIALTAHELRGPLVGARAAIERAYETHAGDEGRELLRRTQEELMQLADLIDPLLRWSVASEPITRERTDLVRVVNQAARSSSLGARDERLVIEASDHPFVLGDARQLRGAIANVIRNSLAYSPATSPVTVVVGIDERMARVEVTDHGPGVPPDERQLVFDPFERGRAGRASRRGHGLGLFIARRVLEAHGGSIALRSSRSGASFRLELPVLEGRSERFAS
ncbi:MAG: HAMP domain-containing histidine kinase [Actinobacteria bacterium]|nr:HAMP domain-containing histidine kinase [Actinomycetota bacterium]